MKTILCYGDSNTWGSDPAARDRYPWERRWTGILQSGLGDGFRVIEEGLPGRTTNLDDPIEPGKNGTTYLLPCLDSHRPIDLVTVLLGTNDLKERFGRNASDIAQAAALVARTAATAPVGPNRTPPKVLFMAPPPVARLTELDLMLRGSEEKSRLFARYYAFQARSHGLPFLDTGSVIRSSDIDGIHLDAEELPKLAQAVLAKIQELLGPSPLAPRPHFQEDPR